MSDEYEDDFELDSDGGAVVDDEVASDHPAPQEIIDDLTERNAKLEGRVKTLTATIHKLRDASQPSRPSSTRSMSSLLERKLAVLKRDNARLSKQIQQYSVAGETITNLENKIREVRGDMKKVLDENKALKRVQREQEKALTEYDAKLAEPHEMVKVYQNELRALKQNMRTSVGERQADDSVLRKAKSANIRLSEKLKRIGQAVMAATRTDTLDAGVDALGQIATITTERDTLKSEGGKMGRRLKAMEQAKTSATRRLEIQLKHAQAQVEKLTEDNKALVSINKAAYHSDRMLEFSPVARSLRGGHSPAPSATGSKVKEARAAGSGIGKGRPAEVEEEKGEETKTGVEETVEGKEADVKEVVAAVEEVNDEEYGDDFEVDSD